VTIDRQQEAARTVDADEITHFSGLSSQWWNPRGPLRALHKFNPVRVGYIRDRTAAHFGRDPARADTLAGLRILDIGCGAGILSEPIARLGAPVVGADPAQSNISAAKLHAATQGLTIDYRCTTAETLATAGEAFDVVLAMEVVEHVADVSLFVGLTAAMVKPGGLMFFATFSRTLKSFLLGIVAAEYILRWVPRGTHQWTKFITPDELAIAIERSGLQIAERTGVVYNVARPHWRFSTDMDVNYMIVAKRPA
jgi:2-polyprenyl-6-hydroxyphenyl methylase / 3-demethylubiquinone-9 3-methyltransferase